MPAAQRDLFTPASDEFSPSGPELDYGEVIRKAREAIDVLKQTGGYEPSTEHAVGQMHADIAGAFAGPQLEGPQFEQPEIEGAQALEAQEPDAPALDFQEPQAAAPVAEQASPQETVSVAEAADGSVFEAEAEGLGPRITIHLFCEQGDTADLGERVLKDRRLARASGAVFNGGLPAALARYRVQTTPSLIIVEAGDDQTRLIADLDRLAEVCDGETKVMVIGRQNDITLYRELVRKGVSDYLVAPLDPLALIGAVSSLYEDPSAPFVGRTIAVVGAKGGVGASVVAHNLAHAFSSRVEANTVLVDLDLPFGAAGLNFNQDPMQGVANALADPERLDSVLLDRMMVRCSDRLSLFASPSNLDDDYDISAPAYAEVTRKIRSAAPFVVLDLPHLWSGWMRQTLLSADEAVIVASPDLTSLRNAKNMIELLTRGRPNDGLPRLVLNQVGVPGRPEISAKDFGEAVGVAPTLILPFEPKLYGQAANNGQMIGEVNAKARAAEAIAGFAKAIARRGVAAPVEAKSSLLANLFKFKS
jgi:pilus assembly protein CpaE